MRFLAITLVLLYLAAVGAAVARAYPDFWLREAQCIHHWEADHDAPSDRAAWPYGWHNRSNPQSRGGFQFLYSTWASVVARHRLHGFPRDPADASRAQQVRAAWLLWSDDHGSWHEWSTAAGCGLR